MTWDPWVDARVAECEAKERRACRLLEKPARPGMRISRVEWREGRAFIDDLHYFEVREQVWNMQINGWQVAKKWLLDRKERQLVDGDLFTYDQLISTLETLLSDLEEVGIKGTSL